MLRIAMGLCAALTVTRVLAQVGGMEIIRMKWADAEIIAATISDQGRPTAQQLHDSRQQWVNDFAGRVAQRLRLERPPERPRWLYGSSVMASPWEQVRGQGTGRSGLRPEGIEQLIVLRDQNALLVRGTPAAIDELREIISMLDVRPRMVNIEVRLEDAPRTQANEWGLDFATKIGDLLLASRGNAPAGGLQTRWSRGNTDILMGWDQRESTGHVLTGASITTTNNFPAIITVGRLLPVFYAETTYDQFGNRHVETYVDGVFVGTELFVQPRINNDDTVTMLLRPTFIEAVGQVIGPDGTSLPITETVAAETQVTVRDGETLQIGGFERGLQELNTRWSGFLLRRNIRVDSHPAMFVTPTIIREVPMDGGQ